MKQPMHEDRATKFFGPAVYKFSKRLHKVVLDFDRTSSQRVSVERDRAEMLLAIAKTVNNSKLPKGVRVEAALAAAA